MLLMYEKGFVVYLLQYISMTASTFTTTLWKGKPGCVSAYYVHA